MKVLIADDSMLMRNIIGKTVDQLGHDIIEATNGREVLDQLAQNKGEIDLILLDWNMPILDGFGVLERMKGHKQLESIPVLMVSTESEDESVQRALDAGVRGYLPKPFTPDELATAIRETVSGRP